MRLIWNSRQWKPTFEVGVVADFLTGFYNYNTEHYYIKLKVNKFLFLTETFHKTNQPPQTGYIVSKQKFVYKAKFRFWAENGQFQCSFLFLLMCRFFKVLFNFLLPLSGPSCFHLKESRKSLIMIKVFLGKSFVYFTSSCKVIIKWSLSV